MITVSVGDAPAALRAAVLAMKRADSGVRRDVAARMRETMNPAWRQAVESRARTNMDARILGKGARIGGGNPPQLVAASSTRKLSGGIAPNTDWQAYEFGANREKTATYTTHSRKGKAYKVTRHTARQLPPRTARGRVLYPAAAEILPRVAAYFVQSVVRAFMDAADGRAD